MKRTRLTALMGFTLLAYATVATLSGNTLNQSAAAEGVKVTVKYTGKGDVDATHRLWVWLFDTPDISAGAIPVAEVSLEKNGETATFAHVAPKSVWIAVAYDVKGGFSGSAPPPSGSPVMLYGAETGSPTSVTPGEKADVSISFDDTQKMP
jgi:hypothetical protein